MKAVSRLALVVCCLAAGRVASPPAIAGEGLSKLVVGPDRRFLVRADGRPFFWLGDTAWALHQNLKRDDVLCYLDDARAKRFTVIQRRLGPPVISLFCLIFLVDLLSYSDRVIRNV